MINVLFPPEEATSGDISWMHSKETQTKIKWKKHNPTNNKEQNLALVIITHDFFFFWIKILNHIILCLLCDRLAGDKLEAFTCLPYILWEDLKGCAAITWSYFKSVISVCSNINSTKWYELALPTEKNRTVLLSGLLRPESRQNGSELCSEN